MPQEPKDVLDKRYPRLRVVFTIHDTLTKKTAMAQIGLSPEELSTFGTAAFITAAKALAEHLLSPKEFKKWLQEMDPLWAKLLIGNSQNVAIGPTRSTHPIIRRMENGGRS